MARPGQIANCLAGVSELWRGSKKIGRAQTPRGAQPRERLRAQTNAPRQNRPEQESKSTTNYSRPEIANRLNHTGGSPEDFDRRREKFLSPQKDFPPVTNERVEKIF